MSNIKKNLCLIGSSNSNTNIMFFLSLTKLVSNKLGFKFLNSGMIYRSFTNYFLSKSITPDENERILNELNNSQSYIIFINGEQHVFINDVDFSLNISNTSIQQNVSLFSQNIKLREYILELQRNFASKNNVVIEGRDIGTEVFPNAKYKFYVVCDMNIRANRRLEDLKKLNSNITLNEVVQSLENRDYLDSTRKISPLKKPIDAIIIDTSNSTIDESVNEILSHITKE